MILLRSTWTHRCASLLVGLLPGVAICQAQTPTTVDFAHDIAPIIKARCGECHTNGNTKGDLSLDTRESLLKAKAAVPGKSLESDLFKRITSQDPMERMPPKGDALSAKQVDLMRNWIDQGLSWQTGFSFKAAAYVPPLKPRRPTLPATAKAARYHPIDRIVALFRLPQSF